MADSIIIMVIALVVFGPRRLPQIGRQIGKLMYEFRKASNDFKFQMEEELRASEEAERRRKEEAERERIAALTAQSQASVSAPPQTVEAAADIGAVEAPTPPGYPESYPPESPAMATEQADAAPVIQPPQTGEQVSARPDYHYGGHSGADSESAAATEVNPDADVAANAEEFSAGGTPVADCHPEPTSISSPETPSGSEPDTPSKETVSQHG